MNVLRRGLVLGVAAFAAVGVMPHLAAAENVKLRMAYILADTMLPILAAQDAGDFAKAGIDLTLTEVQGGPAVVAAIASGEADVGYSAPVPPINARLNGVPVKMFLALGHEVDPDRKFTWLVAGKASGIADLAGVKGKKVAFNANGGLCELAWRDHLRVAGIAWADVQPIVLPFPEMEAALQQGSIDAACVVNPFFASIGSNADIGAVTLASGMLADESTPSLSDVLYTTDDFLAANKDALTTFSKTVQAARDAMLADRPALEAAAQKYMGLTADAAKSFNLPVVKTSTKIDQADVQKLLDAMNQDGMLASPVTANDMSVVLDC
jgi:ABC-type nitrate/sulfonate/bicarbonate transport system substrate-binding protein